MTAAPARANAELVALLAEAQRFRRAVKLFVENTFDAARPAREVEGVVTELSEGKDSRMRVRIAIPTGSGEPVEVRVLLDSVQRYECVDLPGSSPWPSESGPRTRTSTSMPPPAASPSGFVRRSTREFGRE